MTAATEQAGLFRALADHLDAHPDLPAIWTGLGVQIVGDHGRGIVAWARSLDLPAIDLQPLNTTSIAPTRVHGQVRGDIDGHLVTVWCEIPELSGTDRNVIAVDELEQLLDAQAAATPEAPATAPDTATATAPRKDPA